MMSGPKYYNFMTSTPEEAAGIYAQLSAFQRGVRVRVVNNELQFTVSNWAWYQGVNYTSIQAEINKARERYRENEELKRILREKKAKEQTRIRCLREEIASDYKAEKAKLEKARARCAKIKNEATILYDTPFGTYDLKSEFDSIIETEKTILLEQSSLDKQRMDCIEACDRAEDNIAACSSLSGLATIQSMVSQIAISESNIANAVDDLEATVHDKSVRLKNFVSFLNKFYQGMKNKNLTGYLDRIKQEIAVIDIFDADAPKKLERILSQLESETALLKEKELSNADNKEIAEKVSVQLNLLHELSSALAPVLKSIVVENVTTVDYSKRSFEIMQDCDGILRRIGQFEFVSGKNKGQADRLKRELSTLRTSAMSGGTLKKLEGVAAKLHALEGECAEVDETYQKFKEEYTKYEEIYVKLQGFLSADGSALEDDEENAIFVSPTEIFLAYDNPDEQIEGLKKRNIELTKLLNNITQESMCNAVGVLVANESWGEVFKKEKRKDGSLHLTYIRKENKGAIFDVDCGANGKVGIFPRGVVLCNGKMTVSPEELQKVHASCAWADEIRTAFGQCSMSDSGSYEEMPEEILKSLYDKRNYYFISSLEESVRFLQLSGYSQEEIDSILETEKEADVEEEKKKQRTVVNAAHAEKK